MSKRAATPVRFDPAVAERLSSFVAANPGMSLSSAANRLVDEALRMSEHPGIVFRPGPTGRRAGLVGGPDVWEVVRAVKSARAVEPGLAEDDLLTLVAENTGLPARLTRVAVRRLLVNDLSSAGLLRPGPAGGKAWKDAGHCEGGVLGDAPRSGTGDGDAAPR
jgi:hypothetical protein